MERQDEVVRGSKHYVREAVSTNHGDTTDWYRISSKYLRRDGKKVPWVPVKTRDPEKHEWWFIHLRPNAERVESGQVDESGLILDEKLIRKLENQFNREEEQRLEMTQKLVLAMEEARHASPLAETETPEKKPAKIAPVTSSTNDEIKRDKHGIKLWSHGGNYNLSVCVNNATKYPGEYSVRLLVAGRKLIYTFGKKEMRAITREFARALSARELQELLLEGRT